MDAAGLPGGVGCPFREAADTGTAVTASAGRHREYLNQTARKVNSGQWSSGDRVQVVAALMAIERELRSLRQMVREQRVQDDS